MRKIVPLLALSVLLAQFSASAEILDSVTYTIRKGWNAVFLPVTPQASADSVFADWPVESVGCYDQAAFLRTRQFETSAGDSTLGAIDGGMRMWFRGEPGKSGFSALLANAIYVFKATNESPVVRTVCGVPQAMRISWHVSSGTNAPLNFVGVSTDGEPALMAENAYLAGLDTGWTLAHGTVAEMSGVGDTPLLTPFFGAPKKANLGVVAMDAYRSSEWSGVFRVSPATGLDFGTNGCQGVLSVRNDSGTNRTVEVSVRRSESNLFAAPPLPGAILFFDPARHSAWQPDLVSGGYVCELAAGETLSLRLAVDRTAYAEVEPGTECGGLVSVTDVSAANPSHFRTTVPFSFRTAGAEFLKTRWPKGLWLATLSLDKVSRIVPKDRVESYREEVEAEEAEFEEVTTNELTRAVTTNFVMRTVFVTNQVPVYATDPTPAGSVMTMRVLMHVDANGAMKLLQRARVNGRRLSSVALPTDAPTADGTGTFGKSAAFGWTVGAGSRSNPFRHARHPDHDGLDAYFEKPAPDGDDFANYSGVVKPELFSVGNELSFSWDASAAGAWNPDERLSGACAWRLRGLRREGAITASGTFVMRRVSASDLAELEEPFN